jgi:hypothetical protein
MLGRFQTQIIRLRRRSCSEVNEPGRLTERPAMAGGTALQLQSYITWPSTTEADFGRNWPLGVCDYGRPVDSNNYDSAQPILEANAGRPASGDAHAPGLA